jgi:hypothetical protein
MSETYTKSSRVWRVLPGDWRSGAYGANRRAHLFVYRFGGTRKVAACGTRTTDKYARTRATGQTACFDCLAYGASHGAGS